MNIIVMWGALCETFLVVEFKKASNVKHRINLAFLERERDSIFNYLANLGSNAMKMPHGGKYWSKSSVSYYCKLYVNDTLVK